jgi:GTP-binding protein
VARQVCSLQAAAFSLSLRTEFVRSAADASGFPADGLPEVALVGRSNVGKSTLVNALIGQSLARTSARPGKTRLVNLFRVSGALPRPFYLVDLPGYGYARGGRPSREAFEALTTAYFRSWEGASRRPPAAAAAIQLVDARHPGLDTDLAAYDWLAALGWPAAVVATKVDKLTRAERTRAQRQLDTAFNGPVLPVSAATGEGMKDLWTLIARLLSSHPPRLTPRPR